MHVNIKIPIGNNHFQGSICKDDVRANIQKYQEKIQHCIQKTYMRLPNRRFIEHLEYLDSGFGPSQGSRNGRSSGDTGGGA